MVRDGFLSRISWWLCQKLIYSFFERWKVLYMVEDGFSMRI